MDGIRELLESYELDKGKINTVMGLFGKSFNPMKAELETAKTELAKANKELEAAQKEVDSITEQYNGAYEKDEETYKAKYEAATAELETAKAATATAEKALADRNAEIETEKTNAALDKAYTEFLTESGLRPDLIGNELKLVNRESLALDKDGKLKNADKVLADAKTRWANDFAEAKPGGVVTPAGNPFARNTPPGASITSKNPDGDIPSVNQSANAAIRGFAGKKNETD